MWCFFSLGQQFLVIHMGVPPDRTAVSGSSDLPTGPGPKVTCDPSSFTSGRTAFALSDPRLVFASLLFSALNVSVRQLAESRGKICSPLGRKRSLFGVGGRHINQNPLKIKQNKNPLDPHLYRYPQKLIYKSKTHLSEVQFTGNSGKWAQFLIFWKPSMFVSVSAITDHGQGKKGSPSYQREEGGK